MRDAGEERTELVELMQPAGAIAKMEVG
jgi:hypothetical protein